MALLRHHLNSLHIYCRLRKLGIGRERGLVIARGYERIVHPILYSAGISSWFLLG